MELNSLLIDRCKLGQGRNAHRNSLWQPPYPKGTPSLKSITTKQVWPFSIFIVENNFIDTIMILWQIFLFSALGVNNAFAPAICCSSGSFTVVLEMTPPLCLGQKADTTPLDSGEYFWSRGMDHDLKKNVNPLNVSVNVCSLKYFCYWDVYFCCLIIIIAIIYMVPSRHPKPLMSEIPSLKAMLMNLNMLSHAVLKMSLWTKHARSWGSLEDQIAQQQSDPDPAMPGMEYMNDISIGKMI